MLESEQSQTDSTAADAAERQFRQVLADMTALKNQYVEENRRWYDHHSRGPMLLYRTTGVLLIVLSASVPLLSTLDGIWLTLVLPIVAVMIAVLAGLNAFFQWNETWQRYRQAQFRLDYILVEWDLAMHKAGYNSNREEAAAMVIEATETLLAKARRTTADETRKYFEGLELPASGGPSS